MKKNMQASNGVHYTRINNDVNGNPRFVVHFFRFITTEEREADHEIFELFEMAVKRAKKIGGKRFHNKQYGGGIVFQAYTPDEVERYIAYEFDFLKK